MKENSGITKKAAIARGAGVDRNTVIKYYDEIVAELQQERLRSERKEQLEHDGHISVKISSSQELSDYIIGEFKNKNNIRSVCYGSSYGWYAFRGNKGKYCKGYGVYANAGNEIYTIQRLLW